MKLINSLSAPVYVKLADDFAWPSDSMFYLLTGEGPFICRSHPFFTSSVKVDKAVNEMPTHKAFLIPNYPFISALSMERVVGWFKAVAKEHGSEAIVLLCWNAMDKRLEIVCPKQTAEWGDVKYTVPDMPPGWTIIGDIHSHVNMPAYSSFVDDKDEKHRAGLHIVVGKVCKKPEFHCNAVVDGESFTINDHSTVFEYDSPSTYPAAWMNQLTVSKKTSIWPWKGKSKYDDKEYSDKYDSEGYEHKPYVHTPFQSIVDKKDLPATCDRFIDLPGGKVLKWPTDGEKELIALYEEELRKTRLQFHEATSP